MSGHQARVAAAVDAALAAQAAELDGRHAAALAAQATQLRGRHVAAVQQLQAEHGAALAAQAASHAAEVQQHAAAVQQLKAGHAAALAAHVCTPPPMTMKQIYARHANNEACMAAVERGDVVALQSGLEGLSHEEVAALRDPVV